MTLISRNSAGNLGVCGEAVLFAVALVAPIAAFWSILGG